MIWPGRFFGISPLNIFDRIPGAREEEERGIYPVSWKQRQSWAAAAAAMHLSDQARSGFRLWRSCHLVFAFFFFFPSLGLHFPSPFSGMHLLATVIVAFEQGVSI